MKLKSLLRTNPKEMDESIYFFARKKFYWNQIPAKRMGKLLRDAKEQGWLSALKETLLPLSNEYTFNYAVKEARGDWHFFTPTNANSKILDLGCGWGASTLALARNYSYVCAADSTLETLKFLRIRAEQEGIENLDLAVLDPLDYGNLPFKKDSFDMVVLNGVLEWTGTEDKKSKPRDIQVRALREIRRVLAPDGVLYIGIENRFAATYFCGTKDHSGVRFTSLLPRSLANLVMHLAKGNDYRTLTYSYWGYKKLLQDAGFVNTKIYYPLPTYREPYSVVDSQDRVKLKIVKQYLRSPLRSILLNILYFFRLEKVFIHSFSIVTSEKNKLEKKELFSQLLKKNKKALGIKSKIQDLRIVKIRSKIDNNAAVTFFVFEGSREKPSFLIKMGRNAQVKKYIEKEYRNCKEAQRMVQEDKSVSKGIIAPLIYDKTRPILVFRTSLGEKISTSISGLNYDNNMRLMIDWLVKFQDATQSDQLKPRKVFQKYLDFEVERFLEIDEIKDRLPANLEQKIHLLKSKIIGNKSLKIPLCAMHGDYNPYNIFKDKEDLEVIDWEDFERTQLCIYDIFHLLFVTNRIILKRGFPYQDKHLSSFAEALGMSTEELSDFYLFYLIKFINNEYYSEARQDIFKGNVSRALESLVECTGNAKIG